MSGWFNFHSNATRQARARRIDQSLHPEKYIHDEERIVLSRKEAEMFLAGDKEITDAIDSECRRLFDLGAKKIRIDRWGMTSSLKIIDNPNTQTEKQGS